MRKSMFDDTYDKDKKTRNNKILPDSKKIVPGVGPKSIPLKKHPPQSARLDSWQLINRAISLKKEGKFSEALIFLEKAHDIDPHSFHVLSNKAEVLFELKQFEDSLACYA